MHTAPPLRPDPPSRRLSPLPGTPSSFGIDAADEYGNKRSICNDAFEVVLSRSKDLAGKEAEAPHASRVHGVVTEVSLDWNARFKPAPLPSPSPCPKRRRAPAF